MKSRRTFIKMSMMGFGSLMVPQWLSAQHQKGDYIIGQGNHRYRVHAHWGDLNPAKYPIKDAHEMVIDRRGRLFLLTNETRNNVLIYDRSGKLLDTWGTEYPGAHGLTLHAEGSEEFLYICDYERHQVIKTTLDGRPILTLDFPRDAGHYSESAQF
ncbi:MAG: 6-bladed beta-propeller, partial [Bacteroidota bacterium]